MSVKGILGKKVGMTQIFDENGRVVPVTVLSVTPNVVTQVKTLEKDGYSAAQLGFEDVKVEKLTRPQQGHLYHAGIQPKRFLREIDLQDGATVAVGDEFKADLFEVGEKVQIAGTSKGKGFAGVMKRYNFRGGEMTHGSMIHRKPMSAGATDAARVFKGTKRPGRMGNERVTQQGLKVVQVDTERNLLLVRGAVPGANGGLVLIQKAHF
ncbi:MAG: 50S ribosomal protein L3 [Armatimonadota bacterium]